MDKDRIAGSAKDFAGKVEGAVGDIAAMPRPRPRAGPAKPPARCRICTARPRMPRATPAMPPSTMPRTPMRTAAIPSRRFASSGEKVQDNPLGALLVAGGIGFALALLMTRQPRRPPPRWRYYG